MINYIYRKIPFVMYSWLSWIFYHPILILDKSSYQKWYNYIDNKVILGLIPDKGIIHEIKVNDNKFNTIISVLDDWEVKNFREMLKGENINWLHLKVVDRNPPSSSDFIRAVNFIDKCGGNVYIHCRHAKGRSVCIVIGYLLAKGLVKSVDEGIDYIQKRAPRSINLDNNQISRLKEVEKTMIELGCELSLSN